VGSLIYVHLLSQDSKFTASLIYPLLSLMPNSTAQGITDSSAKDACSQLMVALISVLFHTSKEMNRHHLNSEYSIQTQRSLTKLLQGNPDHTCNRVQCYFTIYSCTQYRTLGTSFHRTPPHFCKSLYHSPTTPHIPRHFHPLPNS
jgi:hypothetical protein